jgi:hypothetical protein
VEVTQFNENVDLVRTRQNFKYPQQTAEVCSVESIVGDQEFDVQSWIIVTYRYTFYNSQEVCERTNFYNKIPGYIKEMDTDKAFKKKLKSFLYIMHFTRWRNLSLCSLCVMFHLASKYTYCINIIFCMIY